MDTGAVRRVVIVLLGYLVSAWVVVLCADWVAALLALPPLFDSLLRWGLALGLPFALFVAWTYPRIGHHGEDR